MMREFILKTDPAVFKDVLEGRKTFEIRFNDRGYQVGDLIVLKETKFTGQQMGEGSPLIYTGREMQKQISYILSGYGLQDGWVILGIIDLDNQQAIINDLKAQLECCRKENAVLLGKVGEGEKRVSELNQWNSNQYELIKRNESHTQSLRHLLQKLIDDDYTTMRPSMAYEIQEILRGAND